ncbi:MAG: hypothetical protein PHS02_02690 [Candidatus ainarchaeum sp.]|nr:hypothetical protein [Candidatus ainarchaeum sp.]
MKSYTPKMGQQEIEPTIFVRRVRKMVQDAKAFMPVNERSLRKRLNNPNADAKTVTNIMNVLNEINEKLDCIDNAAGILEIVFLKVDVTKIDEICEAIASSSMNDERAGLGMNNRSGLKGISLEQVNNAHNSLLTAHQELIEMLAMNSRIVYELKRGQETTVVRLLNMLTDYLETNLRQSKGGPSQLGVWISQLVGFV